jgi:hypothetical protein
MEPIQIEQALKKAPARIMLSSKLSGSDLLAG